MPPLGYRLNPDKPGVLEIDNDTAPTIQKAFEAFRLALKRIWTESQDTKAKANTQNRNRPIPCESFLSRGV